MRAIYFSFGYMDISKWNRFTYNLCKALPFIPTIECDLFKTYYKSTTPFIIKHSIYIGFLKYYYRFYKIKDKWRVENLSNKTF